MDDTPYPCAPGGSTPRPTRRTLFLILALFVLAASPSLARGTEPCEGAVRLSNVELSPDGRWVAMTCLAEDGQQAAVWLVDLASTRPPRAVEGDLPALPKALVWGGDGHLGVDFARRHAGRHWIDPETGEVLRVDRAVPPSELEGGWASVELRKKASGRALLEIHWVERGETFTLPDRIERPDRIDHDVQLTRLSGVVFFATCERGVLRIFRCDMQRDVTDEIHEIASDSPFWSVSPDGSSIAVRDQTRLRVIDATNGETIAGPWAAGSLSWLEDDGSRFARLGAGGHAYLLDLWSGRQVHVGRNGPTLSGLHVLSDGRFLIHRARGRLDLMAADGELLRNLVPGERGPRTAAR